MILFLITHSIQQMWGEGTSGKLGSGSTANIGNSANEMGEYLPPLNFGFFNLLLVYSLSIFYKYLKFF